MTINETIKKIPALKPSHSHDGLVFATVAREELARAATALVLDNNLRLSLLYGTDDRADKHAFGVHVIFSQDAGHERLVVSADIPENDPQYPSITRTVMAAHWYERYLCDMFGVVPQGHPDLRRLVHHENIPFNTHPLRKDFNWNKQLDHADIPYPMHHVEGEGIYEIPVGPIHAGIIEPGHFRFNVAGERIITLEGKLFFTHKGVEKLMEGKTIEEALPYIERISGDMSAAHASAYAQAVESKSGCKVPERALILRSLILELERMTMHVHDLANIGGMGTGYSFVAANGFRIKENLQRLSERLLGNRFWRGFIVPGGVAKDFTDEELKDISDTVHRKHSQIRKIVSLALSSEGFLDRLQTTGLLPKEAAQAFGAVGLPARASGVDLDVRRDYPYAAYAKYPIEVVTKSAGDVYARYKMRSSELKRTVQFIDTIMADVRPGEVKAACEAKDGFSLGAVESWRGEILCALYIKGGAIDRCFPRDPSFVNWPLFGIIGPGNIVPDFPICNKSLNLSYSGTDL